MLLAFGGQRLTGKKGFSSFGDWSPMFLDSRFLILDARGEVISDYRFHTSDLVQIGNNNDIGIFTGGNTADEIIKPEMLRHIDGRHLDGRYGIKAESHRLPYGFPPPFRFTVHSYRVVSKIYAYYTRSKEKKIQIALY